MVIGKTATPHGVCLNPQIILLLREFNWKGFNEKTRRLIGRMTSWLGIRGYRYKHTMMSLATRYKPSLELAKRIAGHNNPTSALVYTEEALLAVNL